MSIVAGVAVWLQDRDGPVRPAGYHSFPLMTIEWPEEGNTKIEGKERLDLEKAEDVLEKRAKEAAQRAAAENAAAE